MGASLPIGLTLALEVESFSTVPEQWAQWRKLPVGAFLVGRQRVPAWLQRSPLGLQFFACAPGHGGSSEPESVEHQIAKIALVKGSRAVGCAASVERPGCSPLGEEWIADVFAQISSGPVVFEAQLSQQHWDDYRLRTQRYAASGAPCMWLVRDTHFNAFKARIRHLMSQGLTLQQAMNQRMPDMPAFPARGNCAVDQEPGQRAGSRLPFATRRHDASTAA